MSTDDHQLNANISFRNMNDDGNDDEYGGGYGTSDYDNHGDGDNDQKKKK